MMSVLFSSENFSFRVHCARHIKFQVLSWTIGIIANMYLWTSLRLSCSLLRTVCKNRKTREAKSRSILRSTSEQTCRQLISREILLLLVIFCANFRPCSTKLQEHELAAPPTLVAEDFKRYLASYFTSALIQSFSLKVERRESEKATSKREREN